MDLDCALINTEPLSQNINVLSICVPLDELFYLGWAESPADPLWGSSFGRFGPQWHHFEEVPETFSLVRVVQVTSHYLHSWSFMQRCPW